MTTETIPATIPHRTRAEAVNILLHHHGRHPLDEGQVYNALYHVIPDGFVRRLAVSHVMGGQLHVSRATAARRLATYCRANLRPDMYPDYVI